MLIQGSAASSARPTLPLPSAFKYLPAGVAFAVMMVFGHGASAEVNRLSLHNTTQTEKNRQLVLTAYQGLANLVPVRQKPGAAAWHEQLVHTILEKDVHEAEETMRTHVQQALESLLVGLQTYMVWDEKRLVDVWTGA